MKTGESIDRFLTEALRGNTGSVQGWWRRKVEGVAALHLGFPDPAVFPLKELGESAKAVLEEEGLTALQYGGGPLAARLKEIITEWTQRAGRFPEGREMMLTMGSQQAIDLVCQLMLEPGAPVAVEAPTYMGFLTNARNYTQAFLSYPVDENGLVVDAMAGDLAARRRAGRPLPRFLYTIPNFHNPAGVTMSLDRRKALMALADEFDFLIVEDDAYGRLSFQPEPPPSLQALDDAERVIHVSTLSKIVAPGLRIAWVVAAPSIVKQLSRLNVASSGFLHGVVAHYCLRHGLDERVERLRDLYSRRCHLLLDLLEEHLPPGTPFTRPDGGFFVWLPLPDGVSAVRIYERGMVPNGVAVMPGQSAYADGQGDDHLRLSFSFAEPAEMERGVKLLSRLILDEMR